MKKLLITLGLATVATAALAQGTVNYGANTAATNMRTNAVALGGTSGVTAASGGSQVFYYEVLTAPSTSPAIDASLQGLLSGPWSDTSLIASNAAAGRINANANAVANNWVGGAAMQSYVIVGWSANEGTTWSQVSARLAGAVFSGGAWSGGTLVNGGFVGVSARANGISGGGSFPSFSLFGASGAPQGTPIGTTTDLFVVGTVPEPSTFALVGLGAAAMMIFRRRK